jgi:hypothetical protein
LNSSEKRNMSTNDQHELRDPDLFAADVHFCLLNDGLRSSQLRRLVRLARNNAELERIFETKVAEFRRYLRESRVPSLWNLPIRIFEWLGDHAQFTAPREALTTLVYVVLALVVFDVMKSKLPWDSLLGQPPVQNLPFAKVPLYQTEVEMTSLRSKANAETSSKIDDWLVKELQQAARSAGLEQLLTHQIQQGLARAEQDNPLAARMNVLLESDEFRKALRAQLVEALHSPDVDSLIAGLIVQKLDVGKPPPSTAPVAPSSPEPDTGPTEIDPIELPSPPEPEAGHAAVVPSVYDRPEPVPLPQPPGDGS